MEDLNKAIQARDLPSISKLADVDGHWKFFTVFTTLQELKGHEEHTYSRRPTGVAYGEQIGRMNWQERREASIEFKDCEPSVLVRG